MKTGEIAHRGATDIGVPIATEKKTRVANLTGEAQESTNFYGKRSRLLAVFATK